MALVDTPPASRRLGPGISHSTQGQIMARKNTITITADDENNGDVFFCELRKKFPTIAATLCTSGTCEVTREEWAAIQNLEGFSDGPDYAKSALVVVQQSGSGWGELTRGKS